MDRTGWDFNPVSGLELNLDRQFGQDFGTVGHFYAVCACLVGPVCGNFKQQLPTHGRLTFGLVGFSFWGGWDRDSSGTVCCVPL